MDYLIILILGFIIWSGIVYESCQSTYKSWKKMDRADKKFVLAVFLAGGFAFESGSCVCYYLITHTGG